MIIIQINSHVEFWGSIQLQTCLLNFGNGWGISCCGERKSEWTLCFLSSSRISSLHNTAEHIWFSVPHFLFIAPYDSIDWWIHCIGFSFALDPFCVALVFKRLQWYKNKEIYCKFCSNSVNKVISLFWVGSTDKNILKFLSSSVEIQVKDSPLQLHVMRTAVETDEVW